MATNTVMSIDIKSYGSGINLNNLYSRFSQAMYDMQSEIDTMLNDEKKDLSDINTAFDLQALMNGLTYLSTTASAVLKGNTEMLTNMARAMKQ